MHRIYMSVGLVGIVIVSLGNLAVAQVPLVTPAHRSTFLSANEAKTIAATLAFAVIVDGGVREDVQESRSPLTNKMARFGNAFGDPRYLVPVLGAGWLLGHAAGSHTLSRTTLRAAEAGLVASSISGLMKFGLGRVRPFAGAEMDRFRPLSSNGAFPSGHTTVAFAVATVLARETPDHWSDVGFYGLASLTALSRLNDDQHWTSDVVAGALIGYLVGRQIVPRHARGGLGDARLMASPQELGVSIMF